MTAFQNVYWDQNIVGKLSQGENESLEFAYDPNWIHSTKPPISVSMPVLEKIYTKEAQTFFGNLLPEGDFRRRIEKLFKVSADNDYSLLNEIGGDCAGALTIGREIGHDESAFYATISPTELDRIVTSEGLAGFGQNGQWNRLSLAGAQGKLPVRIKAGQIELPHQGAASTHILKFNRQNGEYPHLVENEYYMNRAAHHLGLKVVTSQLMETGSGPILIVERYDRSHDEWPRRYHQEDFCQALAFSQHKKYEKEGGPSFAMCIQLARRHMSVLDVSGLLDWFLFNLLMGNSDAHAKNISILHRDEQVFQLAPFYDLVCTRAYERLDRKLAMRWGSEFDPDLINPEHVIGLAEATGVTSRLIKSRLQQFLTAIPDARQKALNDLQGQGFNVKTIQNVVQIQDKLQRGFAKRFLLT